MKNHHRIRRRVLLVLGCMTAWPGAGAFAESSPPAWPSRPITIIVANPAGSATDTLARIAAEGLSADLKQPVIIDNKPGAQGIIGVQAFKSRQGDDHTLIVSFSGLNSSNPWLFKEQKYHYRDDFTHIVPLVRAPSLLLVNADAAWHSLAQLLQAARKDPARLAYAYGQATSQVMGELSIMPAGFRSCVAFPIGGNRRR
ncbi:lipoprotein [Bordetella trematum]|nr:lipoprotein [Bordetella trematum]